MALFTILKTFEVWKISKVTPNLCCFQNSEGFDLNHHPEDLRGLEDLKGGPQRSENSEGFIFSSKFAKKAHPYSEPDSLTRTS